MKSFLFFAAILSASVAYASPPACIVSLADVGMDPGEYEGCMVMDCGAYQVTVDDQVKAFYKFGSFDYVGGTQSVEAATAHQAALSAAGRLKAAGVCAVIQEQ